jgi:hypothetical protein
MKNIIFILIITISVFFCNAQKNERFELNNKNTNTTISECDDVSNLQYYQKGSSINLSWDVPGQIDLSHSDDFDGDAIGSSLDFTVGHKFEPEDLEDYVGEEIELMPVKSTDYSDTISYSEESSADWKSLTKQIEEFELSKKKKKKK